MAKEGKKKRPTLKSVAEAAGVSPSTASLVAHGKGSIPDRTRNKVLLVMKDVGYQGPVKKRNLASQSPTSAIGIIGDDIDNPYYSELVKAVSETVETRGLFPLLVSSQGDVERQSFLINSLCDLGVRGIILVPANHSGTETLDLISVQKTPVILGVRHIGFGSFDYVGPNYFLGMQLATRHLVELGHKRIAFVGGEPENTAYSDRLAAWRITMETAGLNAIREFEINGPPTTGFGNDIIPQIMNMAEPPTGIIAYNDITAFGLMSGLRDLGLTPGQDISIVGFDDIRESARRSTPLTTVSTPPARIGQELGKLLLSRIDDPATDPVNIIPPPTLVVRASCSALS